jgi:ParB/RepB/Spo0J family partition protein
METREILYVDPKTIRRPAQVRTQFDKTKMAELVATVQRVGILQPVLARREGSELIAIAGDRRIQAAIEARIAKIPVWLVDKTLDTAEMIERQMIENGAREDLNPIDQAAAIRQLMELTGCTASEAAIRIGRSAGTVSKLLSLLEMSPEDQAKVARGEIGLAAAYRQVRSGAKQPNTEASSAACKPRTRFTATLDAQRSISFGGIDPTFDTLIPAIEEVLTRFKAARKQGVELRTCLAMFHDQAKA